MLARRCIAVIDDDEGSRSSMAALLHSLGFTTQSYDSADAYLADVGTPCECIISDIHMPGLDGFELLAALRQRHGASPVILMTAYPTRGTQYKALAAGAANFFEKPVNDDVLLCCLAGIFRQDA